MRITTVANPKGGSTKTATVVSLAAIAATNGLRVLLVDLDKQGSATQWLNHSPDNEQLAHVLLGTCPVTEAIVSTEVENLSLLRASVLLAQAERFTSEPGHQFLLREALSRLPADVYDWVLIDTPGDLGPMTIMALTAATDVLVPLPAGAMELDEVPKIRDTIRKVRDRLNPSLVLSGVLLGQVRTYGRSTSVLARQIADRLAEDFPGGELMTATVRDDGRFKEAPAWRQPINIYAPGSRGDLDYRAVLSELQARYNVQESTNATR